MDFGLTRTQRYAETRRKGKHQYANMPTVCGKCADYHLSKYDVIYQTALKGVARILLDNVRKKELK